MEALVRRVLSRLDGCPVHVAVVLPGGARVGARDAAVTLRMADWSTLAVLAAGQIGSLAEEHVEGRMDIDGSMRDLMAAAAHLLPGSPVDGAATWWTQALRRARSLGAHTQQRDAEQIQFHYDVSDDFYALWLDERRVYSCAYWPDVGMALAQAQEAKLELICRKLALRPGERFLDIGAGWGGLLLWAAERHGVQAHGITLSRNQHAHVSRLIEQRGLGGRVRVELRDWRDLDHSQPFDKIASVGMFEHVGLANMGRYMAKVRQLLRPGGLALNHGITAGGTDNAELGAGMGQFIGRYIFPGGELLHVSQVLRETAQAGLEMVDTENLRPHYARTLWAWSDALEARLDEARRVLRQGAGAQRAERILRAYRLYLAGSAMSFERGWIALHQMLSARPGGMDHAGAMRGAQSDYPFNRAYMYR